MSGSAAESNTPGPEQLVEQMREVTDRLRDQAWMVAPLTSSVELPTTVAEKAAGG